MEVETREGRADFIKPFGQRVGSEWFLSPTFLYSLTSNIKPEGVFLLVTDGSDEERAAAGASDQAGPGVWQVEPGETGEDFSNTGQLNWAEPASQFTGEELEAIQALSLFFHCLH